MERSGGVANWLVTPSMLGLAVEVRAGADFRQDRSPEVGFRSGRGMPFTISGLDDSTTSTTVTMAVLR